MKFRKWVFIVSSWGKVDWSLMRIPSGIFQHCYFDENFIIVFLCIFEKLFFFNFDQVFDLGRSRIVSLSAVHFGIFLVSAF